MSSRWVPAVFGAALALAACRIETAAPGGSATGVSGATASGEVWVYTSIYHPVLDALDPLIRRALPEVKVRWYQAGSEKVANRLDAELAAGGTPADLLLTSDPFLYERLKRDGALLRYASPNALRTPRALMDLDGHYTACRVSTMVLAYRSDVGDPPQRFRDLTDPRWRGEVALGDPLTSGTAFTWALAMEREYGESFFDELRANGAVVAGGNAAVMQKIESGEARVGVLLLENSLAGRASGGIQFSWPSDGAVAIPGPIAVFRFSRNAAAAKALYDFLLSPEAQALIVSAGDMHSVDPRLPGPRGERGLDDLLAASRPWDEGFIRQGVDRGAAVKAAFARAFQK
jgi:iron(III) transport system substrate-binding protein